MSEDDPADPFEQLEDDDANSDSRDPFADLDSDVDDIANGPASREENAPERGAADEKGATNVDEPGTEVDGTVTEVDGTVTEVDEPGVARDDVDGGSDVGDGPGATDAFERVDDDVDVDGDPFERMRVTDVSVDDVWEAIDEGDEEPEMSGEARPFDGDDGDPADRRREDHVVDKREYCQRCPYFSSPPEVACDREETEIVEVMSLEEFRVRGCPMVAEEGPQFDSS